MKKSILIICLLTAALGCNHTSNPKIPGNTQYAGMQKISNDSVVGSEIDTLQPHTEQEQMKLTYIANMGVLLNSGDKKILIDGLFKSSNPNCINPLPAMIEGLINGEMPYDGVDIALITHKDQDHFNPGLIYDFMVKQPEVIVVMPADAMEAMREAGFDLKKVERRIISVNLKPGESINDRISGIPITIMCTRHGTSDFPMNLMYLLDLNCWKVFHEGDGPGRPEDYQVFGFEKSHIDLGIVQYRWPFHPHLPYRNFFKNEFFIDHIALAHISASEAKPTDEKVSEVSRDYSDIFPLLPGMTEKIFSK